MRKNALKILLTTISVVIIVCALFAGFTACNGNVNWSTAESNMNKVSSMTCKIVMTDKMVNVFDYTKEVTVEGANASVTVTETKLSDNFQYETESSSKNIENIDKSSLLPLNVSSDVLTTLKKSKSDGLNVYGAELEEVFMKQILKTAGEFDINGTATLKIKCKGNEIREITLDYVTKTGRVVSAVYSYVY